MYYYANLFGVFSSRNMENKSVDFEEWERKAANFQRRIFENPYPINLDYYRELLSMVRVGKSVLDVGCGDRHIEAAMPDLWYLGIDPYPRHKTTRKVIAEHLGRLEEFWKCADTVICFASLDNCFWLENALWGLKKCAKQNIVILTGIGIEPDELHTLRIDHKDLVQVLGEPVFEREIKPNVWLFDFDA